MAGKTMKIVLLLSYILAINSFGQTTRNQRELYADFLDGINKQNLSTKFLLNRGFINNDEIETLSQFIESYDEVKKEVIPPMSQMDAISWKQFYSSLLESDINAVKKLPGLEAINNQIINNPKYATSIPLLIFDVKGELLDYNEIQKSIANSPKLNPYNQVHLLGVMSYKSVFYSKTINFSLDLENYFAGTDPKPTEIFIDFSDGRGVQKYNPSQGVVTVTYADLGEKAIKVYKNTVMNNNAMQIGSSFQIEIKSENIGIPTKTITSNLASTARPGFPNDISNAGGTAYVFNGTNGNTFDKPIIIVQGFDPTGQITKESQADKYRWFTDKLSGYGYDMVYVMLNSTNLALPDNTNVVKDLLKQINLKKHGNFESVMIGESMGGLLTRMALKQLENEKYDHKVGLYVSFDAPHQGANIPPGYQYLFRDVMNSTTVLALKGVLNIIDFAGIPLASSIFSPIIKTGNLSETLGVNMAFKALVALDSPAAKSMVVRHINPGNYYTDTQNYLNQLGYPSVTRNIALINGSNNNTIPSFTPGTELIHFPLWNDLCNELSLNAWSSPTNTRARVSQIKWTVGLPVPDIHIGWENRCIQIFGTKICTKVPVKVQVGFKCASFDLQNKEQYYSFDSASYDNAPGSTLPGGKNLPIELKATTTFVPTASSIDLSKLAYNNITNPNGLKAITSKSVLDSFVQTKMVPFEQIYATTQNSTHVYFENNLYFIFNDIIDNEIMPLNLKLQNKTINFNRDFVANTITIGNDVNDIFDKNVVKGNVVMESNTIVNVNAGKQIVLKPGTVIKNGSNAVFKINNISSSTSRLLAPKNNLHDFDITIIGEKNYAIGQSPSFKVLVSNPDLSYNYKWELIENSNINSSNDEFIIGEVLSSGLYTIKVSVTSKTTNETHSLSKVFKIKSSFVNQSDEKNILKLNTIATNVTIYPNPASNETTIIADKEIQIIKITDTTGKTIFENTNLSNTWSSLNLVTFPAGVYVINIVFKDGSTTNTKLIKK
jgi:Secretion system C-terminal sorting domain